MPGIVGLITKRPRQWAEEQLRQMVSALLHESFYESGTWIDEASGVYAGWGARKDSFCDQMPLRNERKDRVLLFSGEEYPEPGIAALLESRGHALEDKPASYLVHVAEEDPEFPKSLNGRFHGLLFDQSAGTAALFTDRYGMQRLYYHEAGDAFFFAGEAKAILAVRPELRDADSRSMGEVVACGCVLEDRTLFRDIRILPTASKWVFANGALLNKGKYFESAEWENQGPLDQEAYYAQLKEVFSRNLPRYF